MIRCEICGQEVEKITDSHLRSHGIDRSKYLSLVSRKMSNSQSPNSSISDILKDAINNIQEMDPNYFQNTESIETIVSRSPEFKKVLIVLALARSTRINRLLSIMDKVEEKIDQHRLDDCDVNELMSIYTTMSRQLRDTTNALKELIESGLDDATNSQSVHFIQNNFSLGEDLSSPVDRSRLLKSVQKLLSVISKEEAKSVNVTKSSDKKSVSSKSKNDDVVSG